MTCRSPLFLVHLQGKLRIDKAAVVAGRMRQLGAAALRAADVMDRPQGMMGAAFALARLAVFLNREHDQSPTIHPGPPTLASAAGAEGCKTLFSNKEQRRAWQPAGAIRGVR